MATITQYTVDEAMELLTQKMGMPIKQADLARILNVSRQYIIQMKNKPLPEKYTNIIDNKLSNIANDDCIEIEHIHINPSCGSGTVVLAEADVTPVKIGREIIKNIWNAKPENLKIFQASGDSMADTIEDNNILLVDTSKTDYRNGGIFLLTINNDWYIKRLRLRITGELDIISDNSKYPVETLLPDTAKEIRIIGRVIKNLSRGL